MESRSVSRELALLLLGQISQNDLQNIDLFSIDKVLNQALDTLMQYWRAELDSCANHLELAQDDLQESELNEDNITNNNKVREHLSNCLIKGEYIINSLSETIELVRLLSLSDQENIRLGAINRAKLIIDKSEIIDLELDSVMEGWRLKRLPKIDRDILRIAFVEINNLNIPIAVVCNEAVNLANRYSDERGRKMINGILRRLQKDSSMRIVQ
tara:strand:- start:173 stop:811 length:639 start_codon:yes stop_codon:yes gene_type:complete